MNLRLAFFTLYYSASHPVYGQATSSLRGMTTPPTTPPIVTYETIPGHDCIRSMKGMLDSMEDLAEAHPDLLTMTKIGESYLKNNDGPAAYGTYDVPTGGHDIFALNVTATSGAISSTSTKGRFLVTSGVHPREFAPPELLARFVEMLVNGYGEDAEITMILERTEIHAILYVNPDGRWMAEKYPELMWRKNLNFGSGNDDCISILSIFGSPGVDINRNFDFMWGHLDDGASSDDPCNGMYHGPSAESEPETRAVSEYAKRLFPEGQRKTDPEGEVDVPFGESITGIYADIHAAGGYVVYPWGYEDSKTPDDEALQAIGRKLQSFNEYKLWAGSQPDFQYAASGIAIDYMYAALGVASLGLEIGDDFSQECAAFEDEIVPNNMPALLYAAKIAGAPYSEVKGPDVLDFVIVENEQEDMVLVSARASDGELVNAITVDGSFDKFPTGDQSVAELRFYIDDGEISWTAVNPGDETIQETIDTSSLTLGRHTLYVQATDSDGYKGPISSLFISLPLTQTISNPPTSSPIDQSTFPSDGSGDSNFLDVFLDFLYGLFFGPDKSKRKLI